MTKNNPSQIPNWPPKKRHVAYFVILIAVFIVGVTVRFVRGYTLQGEWAVFDSQERLTGQNDPDGFRLEYPVNWDVVAFSDGGSKNLGDLRVDFRYPYYLFTAKQYMSIWWQRTEDDWTRYDVRDWFLDEIPFGFYRHDLRDSFQETEIGMGGYPALSLTYNKTNIRKRIIVFMVNDEAFVLRANFRTTEFETEEIFERMINSIEIYN